MATKRLRYVTRLMRATSSGAATVRVLPDACARQCRSALGSRKTKMKKDGTNRDAMAKGAKKKDETKKTHPSSSIGEQSRSLVVAGLFACRTSLLAFVS
jgi:hypothetical protein